MHRALGYIAKRLVEVRPGEGKKAGLAFLYLFCLIAATYVVKPAGRSLALGALGFRGVPYADLIAVALVGPVVAAFAWLGRLQKPRQAACAFWLLAGALVLFWRLLAFPAPWVVAAFYIWICVLPVLAITLFWSVANDLFHPRQAKRFFAFVGSGGISGAIAGSLAAAFGAQALGSRQLLLLSACLFMASGILAQRLQVPSRPAAAKGAAREGRPTFLSDPSGCLRLLLQSRYLILLAGLVGLAKIVSTLIGYQLNPYLESAFDNGEARTAFLGLFFGATNLMAFAIQLGLTSFLLRRLGLRQVLMAFPAGLCLATAGLLAWPGLWLAAGLELYDGAMNLSVQPAAKEMLYLPIDRCLRGTVKPFIDVGVFRFGKAVAAATGILFLNALRLPPQTLGGLSLPLTALWIAVAFRLSRDYLTTIRTSLQARAASRRAQVLSPALPGARPLAITEPWGDFFGPLTDLPAPARKLSLIDRLVTTQDSAHSIPLHVKDFLAQLHAQENTLSPLPETGAEASRLKAIINDGAMPLSARRQAVRMLLRFSDPSTVDYLFGLLLTAADSALQQEATVGLIRLRLKRRRLSLPGELIRRLIGREAENYRRMVAVAAIYRKHCRGALTADDPALGLLRALLEESVEQIFRLLMLLYRPEEVHLIYEQMQAPERLLRADALEILDTLVDPAVRRMLAPALDEDSLLSPPDEQAPDAYDPTAAYRILQEAMWGHNAWLSVATLCAVGRLRLTAMCQELERASRHSDRRVASAAKTALYLAARP